MNLASFITAQMPQILAEWDSFARNVGPVADKMSPLALRDHARPMLECIASDLEAQRDQPPAWPDASAAVPADAESPASAHGMFRQISGFSLPQMTAELSALRATVLRLWLQGDRPNARRGPDDILRFNHFVDRSLAESAVAFADQARVEADRLAEASQQAAVFNALPAQVGLVDAEGRLLSFNQAWRPFGSDNALQDPGHAVGMNYLDICDQATGARSKEAGQAAAGIRSVLSGESEMFSLEYPCQAGDQTTWYWMRVTPVEQEHGMGAVVIRIDITERKESEAALRESEWQARLATNRLRASETRVQRLNHVYAVLSQVSAMIVRADGREEMFREACRIAVEVGEFRLAWVGLVDRATMAVVPAASVGLGNEVVGAPAARLTLVDDAPEGHGPAATAVREQRAFVANDLANDLRIRRRAELVEHGFRAMACLPIMVAGEVVAVFSLYAAEAGYFDEAELQLLRELAANIAFGLESIERQKRLDYLAYYDDLTGLANRALFLERLGQQMRTALAGDSTLAVCLVDIERFKSINDSLGRPAGDVLLQQVAAWLTRLLGDASLVSRLGVDHFALLLTGVDDRDVLVRNLDALMAALTNHPFALADAVLRVTVKMGVALYPGDGDGADWLLQHAEVALRKAKSTGEHCLFYSQSMSDTVAGKLTMENQLRRALDRGEFELHFQPKVSLGTGEVTSAEALIRWNHPDAGLVSPGTFITVLEETGLIHEAGRFALRKALEVHLGWLDAGLPAPRIAVNVSALQLRNRSFTAEIAQAISVDPRAAAGLELEITESMLMGDIPHAIASLDSVRAMGVTIALDDFGTGFSSLSYLSRLPIDTLKIDRSFIDDMTVTREGLALVSTIITLAHSLSHKVVAEGVETEEQSRLLGLLGCDEMQGFVCGRPVPRGEFEALYLRPSPADEERDRAGQGNGSGSPASRCAAFSKARP